MSQRDPRVDPRPGDVLKRNKNTRFIVQHLPLGPQHNCNDWVGFQSPLDRRRGYITQERPDVFRKWAATAEVIHRAEEKE